MILKKTSIFFRKIHYTPFAGILSKKSLTYTYLEVALEYQMNPFPESISFSSTPRVQSVEEDTSEFTLSCLVSGNPKPTVTWNVKGHIVRPESSSEVSMGRKRKYEAVEGGLIIRNVTKADQGSYKCKARQLENGVTDFKDIVLQLKVQRESFQKSHSSSNKFL